MAANTIPTVSTLPPAPTRADAPADFTTKTDAFVAALPKLVTQVNLTVSGMNDQASYLDQLKTDTIKTTGDNASSASQSANTASGAAATATSARDSAVTAAQAAQASAGLPPLNNPLTYLRQKADKSGVEWAAVTQVITKYFESSPQSILSSSRSSITHGLGGSPKFIAAHIVCISASAGYSVGDKLEMPTSVLSYDQNGTDTICGFAISANQNTIDIIYMPSPPFIPPNPPSAVRPSQNFIDRNAWRLVLRAAL